MAVAFIIMYVNATSSRVKQLTMTHNWAERYKLLRDTSERHQRERVDETKYWKLMKKVELFFSVCYFKWTATASKKKHYINALFMILLVCSFLFFDDHFKRTYGSPWLTIYIKLCCTVHYYANITPVRPAFNWTINFFYYYCRYLKCQSCFEQ